MKKLLLGLGTIAAVAAPIASVVACGEKEVRTITILPNEIPEAMHALFRTSDESSMELPTIGTIINASIDDVMYTHTITKHDERTLREIANPRWDWSVVPKTAKADLVIALSNMLFTSKTTKTEFLKEVYDRSSGVVDDAATTDHHHTSLQLLLKAKLDSMAGNYSLVTLSTIAEKTDGPFHTLFRGESALYKTVGTTLQTYMSEKPAKGLYSHTITSDDVKRITDALNAKGANIELVAFEQTADMLFGPGVPNDVKSLDGKVNFLKNIKAIYSSNKFFTEHGKTPIISGLDKIIAPIEKEWKIELGAKQYNIDMTSPMLGFHKFLKDHNPKEGDTVSITFEDPNSSINKKTLSAVLTKKDKKFFAGTKNQGLELRHVAIMLANTDQTLKEEIFKQFKDALNLSVHSPKANLIK